MLSKFLFVLILLSLYSINSAAAPDKISIDVKSRMLDGDKVPVIIILKEEPVLKTLSKENTISLLKDRANGSQRTLAALFKEEKRKGRADKIKQLWITDAIAVNLTPALIEEVSKRNDVYAIELDSEYHILEDYFLLASSGQAANSTPEIRHINATGVWDLGIDGTGINVSVIDTGVYASHPDIAGRVLKWVDYVNDGNSPYDDNGHGTHVAGTVGGNGSQGTTTGVAPNVSLFAAKVLDRKGDGYESDVISAIQWSIENKAEIISMSLGGSRDHIVTQAVNNAINAGVVVVAAAGNEGPLAETISFPAGEKNVIAVGAVDSSDMNASFSSQGPITVDGEILTKPDVSAPGVNINSLLLNSSGYTNAYSGTSMATPHVSGTAALVLQAARRLGTALSPHHIKTILENTSVDLGSLGKDNIYGAGRIDVYAAVRSLDTAPPLVVPNPTGYHATSAARNGTIITLNATITDTGFGVKNASVNVSSLNSSLSVIYLTNVSGYWMNNSITVNAGDGVYLLNITSHDNVGNMNTGARLSVTVDNIPPLFINASAEPSTIEAGSGNSLFTANISDATSGIAQMTVNLSDIGMSANTGMQITNGRAQLLVNTTRVGNFFFVINASDGAGNFNTSIVLLNVTDTSPPLIYSRAASPDSIMADGTDNTTLMVGTHDFANVSSIVNVTLDLSQLGGNSHQEMQNISGLWLYDLSTNVTGLNGSLVRLPVIATDTWNNSISTSIPLGLKEAIDTGAGNRTLFNFTVDSTVYNASISIPGYTNLQGELFVAPVDILAHGALVYTGVALNFSGISFNRSLVVGIEYNSSQISGNESKIRLWFYNATAWEMSENSSVDIRNRTVSGNIGHFSILAPLADIAPPVISNVTSTSPPPNTASGGGGGGGGGGGASGENYANIVVKEKYDLFIFKDKITSYAFNNRSNPILFVNITGNINAGEIGAAVEVLRNTSTILKENPPGKVYKNVNIWVGTYGFAVPRNIKEAVIRFRVENSWIRGSGSIDVRMVRWDGKQWIKLETVEKGSDSTYTYYEAGTNAFSPLAITGLEKEVEVMPSIPLAIPQATPVSTAIPLEKGVPGFEIILAAAAFLAVYVIRRKE